MKKFLAYLMLPVIALSALSGVTSAANISMTITGDTAASTSNSLTLTLSLPTILPANETITVTTRHQDGSPLPISAGAVSVNGVSMDAVAAGTGSVVITTTADLAAGAHTLTGNAGLVVTNPTTAQNISVIVSTSNGHVGALTFPIAGANTVQVNAYVGSTLSMALQGNTINLGIIPIDAVVESLGLGQSTTITVSTNAVSGYTLNAQTAAWDNITPFRLVAFANNVFEELTAGTEGFAIRVANTTATTLTGAGNIGAGIAGDAPITHTAARGLVHSTTQATAQATTIEYGVAIAADTAEGAYQETVIYSVTANF